MSRGKLATWNFSLTLAFSAITIALGLISTPLLLRYLGAERLGTFRAACDLVGFLTLLDLGTGMALNAYFASAVNNPDRSAVAQGVATGARIYLRLAIPSVIFILSLVLFGPHILNTPPNLFVDLRLGILCVLLSIAVTWLNPLRQLADSRQQGYVIQFFNILNQILIFVLSIFLAVAGMGIAGQFLAITIGGVFVAIVIARREIIHDPTLWSALIGRTTCSAAVSKQIWRMNWASFTISAAGRLSLQADNLLIAMFLGPIPVVIFVASQRLLQLGATLASTVGGSVWAGLAQIYHSGNHGLFCQRVLDATRFTAILSLSAILPAVVWTGSFVRLWIGSEYYAGDAVIVAASVGIWLQAFLVIWGWVFSGLGMQAKLVPWSLAFVVVNVSLSCILTAKFGLIGPVLGTAIAHFILTSWWFPILMRREFGIPLHKIVNAVGLPLLVAILYSPLLYGLSVTVPTDQLSRAGNLTVVVGLLSVGGIGYLAACWFAVLTSEHRQMFATRLRGFFGTAKA